MSVAVIVAPEPLLTAEQARQHLRVDDLGEDVLINAFIAAAIQVLDGPSGGWLGRSLGRQTLELRRNGFPCDGGWIALPYIPIASIVTVAYDDPSGVAQTVDPSAYRLYGSALARLPDAAWPETACNPESVRVRYLAGYDELPAPILAAIRLQIGDLYRFRDTVATGAVASVPMSTTVEALLSPYRVWLG